MSMDKAIESGKEHRKKYTGCKAIDGSCRNHGDCPYCQSGRKHKIKKQELKAKGDSGFESLGNPDQSDIDNLMKEINKEI